MSNPHDRTVSLRRAYDLLERLAYAHGRDTPIRREARQILEHFPGQYELLCMARECPMLEVFVPAGAVNGNGHHKNARAMRSVADIVAADADLRRGIEDEA